MSKQLSVFVSFLMVLLAAACTPAAAVEPVASVDAPTAEVAGVLQSVPTAQPPAVGETQTASPDENEPAAVGGADTISQYPPPVENSVVDATPMSDEELAQQPPGQSEPGGADGYAGAPEPEDQPPTTGPFAGYTNDAYQFALEVPSNFVLYDGATLQTNEPGLPLAARFPFMNPSSAAADYPEYELADLEVRVYEAPGVAAAEDWLRPSGFLDGMEAPAPWQTDHVSGVQVCTSAMIFPGCSFFVAANGYVYQLIAASIEGEAMLQSFRLT